MAAGMTFISAFAEKQPILVIAESVGQYTGVNDTNNNEIYEGDIVNNIEDDRIGVVAFGQLPYGFHQAYYIDWKGKNGQWLRKDLYFWKAKIEVVGNIYENQEDNIND